jgi:hypothetical protein
MEQGWAPFAKEAPWRPWRRAPDAPLAVPIPRWAQQLHAECVARRRRRNEGWGAPPGPGATHRQIDEFYEAVYNTIELHNKLTKCYEALRATLINYHATEADICSETNPFPLPTWWECRWWSEFALVKRRTMHSAWEDLQIVRSAFKEFRS